VHLHCVLSSLDAYDLCLGSDLARERLTSLPGSTTDARNPSCLHGVIREMRNTARPYWSLRQVQVETFHSRYTDPCACVAQGLSGSPLLGLVSSALLSASIAFTSTKSLAPARVLAEKALTIHRSTLSQTRTRSGFRLTPLHPSPGTSIAPARIRILTGPPAALSVGEIYDAIRPWGPLYGLKLLPRKKSNSWEVGFCREKDAEAWENDWNGSSFAGGR
jgi:hypothetical protein